MIVIGIFGGTSGSTEVNNTLAMRLGELVSRKGYIVLTGGCEPGGERVKSGGGVKNKALPPVERRLPWIGVTQEGPPEAKYKGEGLVLRTGLGHRRNYLEA